MTVKHNPLVSVIIPCYNAEKWVADAINGILRQTYSPIEIIVIDDGSTDGSLDVLRSFGDRVRYETGPNRGGSAARNRGFALSRGEYVMFHDADDWIAEDTIAKLVEDIEGTQNTLVLCDWYFSYQTASGARENRPGYLVGKQSPSADPLMSWFMGWRPQCDSILWPRHVIVEIGGWDERITQSDDVDIYVRALLHGVAVKKVDGAVTYWRQDNPNSVRRTLTLSSIHSTSIFIQRLDKILTERDKLHIYRAHLARLYIGLAAESVYLDPELSAKCEKRARELAGFRAFSGGTFINQILCFAFSVSYKERLAQRLAQIGIGRRVRKDALKRIPAHRETKKNSLKL